MQEIEKCPRPGCGGTLMPESYPDENGNMVNKEVCMSCHYGIKKGEIINDK